MKIECRPHTRDKLRLTIFIEDEEWGDIHTSIFGRKPSLPKDCLSLEEFQEKFHALEYKVAKNYLIKRLSAQSLPSTTLAKTLKERLISQENIATLLQEFEQQGYINDSQWTQSFVRQQQARKLGPKAIASKLFLKGFDKETITKALKSTGADSQQEAIAKLLTTRYRQRDLKDFREKQKLVASLVRRGFDLSIILNTLKIDDF